MRHRWAVLGCAAMLAACSSPYLHGLPQGEAATAEGPVFATQLAGPSTFLLPMPTAIVVLRPGDDSRNRTFCEALNARLPTAQQALASSVVAPNLVLTRWLLPSPNISAAQAKDCAFLTTQYDYTRASRLQGSIRLSRGVLSGQGPFLIMVIPDNTGLHVEGIDGSDYPDAELGRFVETWATVLRRTEEAATRTPEHPGFLVRQIETILGVAVVGTRMLVGYVLQSL